MEAAIADTSNEQRYILIEESISGHCCFKYSIIDKDKIQVGMFFTGNICEIFEKEDAIKIWEKLNK